MSRHYGAMPPGEPRGEIEDCYDCGVWWYTGKRGERRWAFALRAGDLGGIWWWDFASGISNFASRANALRFGVNARIVQVIREKALTGKGEAS